MLRRLEQAITDAGGVRALGRRWQISAAHLSNVRIGKRLPGPRVLAKLGLRRLVARRARYENVS